MGYILTDTIPGYELVADVTVSVATTSVTIGGLNFGKSDDLLLVSDVVNPTATESNVYLTCNGNNTYTNYYMEYLFADSTNVGSSRVNAPEFIPVHGNNKVSSIAKLKLTNSGYFVYQSQIQRRYGSSSTMIEVKYGTSTFTVTSITSLTLTISTSNAIGIGTRFQLYRRKATLIADTTISGSAVTSVDFTGLNLTAGNEVMLVSDIVNTSGSYSGYSIYPNGNTSATNYYRQILYAESTIVVGGRENNCKVMDAETGYKTLAICSIKLSNSGYYILQSSQNLKYAGVGININLCYATSTFTASSITQLTVTSSITNSIGIGSRFQLYQMK